MKKPFLHAKMERRVIVRKPRRLVGNDGVKVKDVPGNANDKRLNYKVAPRRRGFFQTTV